MEGVNYIYDSNSDFSPAKSRLFKAKNRLPRVWDLALKRHFLLHRYIMTVLKILFQFNFFHLLFFLAGLG